MVRFLILLFFFFPKLVKAQNENDIENLFDQGISYIYQNQDSAYHYFQMGYQNALQQKNWKKSIYGLQLYNYTCGYYYDLVRYKISIDRLDSLLTEKKNKIEKFDFYREAQTMQLLDKINYYFKTNDFSNARHVLGKMLADLEAVSVSELSSDDLENLFIAYEYAGAMYVDEEKYDIAAQYYQKALRLNQKTNIEESRNVALSNLLASLYSKKGSYVISNNFLIKTLNFHLSDKSKYRNNIVTSSVNISHNYIKLGKLDSAKYFLSITKSVMLDNDPFLPRYFNKLAELYKREGKKKLAFEMYEKALNAEKKKWKGAKNSDIANIYNKIGALHESYNDQSLALESYQNGLQQLADGFNSINIKDNPTVESGINKSVLFETLKGKSVVLNKLKNYIDALSTVECAIVVLDSLKPTFESESDKQLLIENAFPLFESGIEAAYKLYKSTGEKKYIDQAFFYSEKGKGVVLLAALLKTRANDFAKIPLKLIEKEKQLKSLITYLEKRIRRKKNADEQEQLLNAKSEHRKLIRTIETSYRKYYDLKYNTQMATTEMVQGYLKKDNVLISYFYGDKAIYSITIANGVREFHRTILNDSLTQRIIRAHQLLGNPKSNVTELAILTNKLYDNLLAPSLENKKYNKLTIIADGLLNYIPFGSLNVKKEGIRYVMENNSISYASSATLLLQLTGKKNNNTDLLVFAPNFDKHKKTAVSLLPIPNNSKELKQILAYFGGRGFDEDNASLQNFIEEVSNYGMIHLATHAVINDDVPEYSYLAFSPREDEEYLLFVSDVYNLELNASLVTLSACETGIGNLKRGEGMISLSRGFFYSGAASIVNTMWKINDASSSQIMSDFYKHLADGESKEVALQKAKLDFLKENKQNPLKHPYFWSGFVIAGDTTPVVKKNPVWIWLISALLVMVVLGILLFRRRKPKTLIQNPQ